MDLKLSVLLGMIDKVTAPMRAVTGSSAAASKALRETRDRLKELQKAQDQLKGFRDLKTGTQQLGQQLQAARTRATELGRSIAGVTTPTRQQVREFNAARREADLLGQKYQANRVRLQAMREQLSATGMNTRNLSQHERRLRDDLTATNRQLEGQQAQLRKLTEQQQRMAAARQSYERTAAVGAHLSVGGLATMATGQHMLGGITPAIEQAKAFQTQVAQLRALGIGEDMLQDAVKYAKSMDIVGMSATENLKLLKESYSVLRDMHEAEEVTPYLARMKFAIETVMAQGGHGEGHGTHAETMFTDLLKVAELRGAAKDPHTLKKVLDFATQAYVASGGLVSSEDLLNMIKTGGVAAKQLDDQAFFFGMLHTVQEMGGHRAGTGLATAYQNWIAGRTTEQAAGELMDLGLLDPNAVKYGRDGKVKMTSSALQHADLYRSNPFQYLQQHVIPAINPDGNLTDMQVVSKINALYSGRKGGDLMASLFMERANIQKHIAAAPKAYGVDSLYSEATQTAQGQEADLLAKKANLYRELGTQLLPLYVAGLTKLTKLTAQLSRWTQAHPWLAKGLLIIVAALGTLAVFAGGTMIALGGLITQFGWLRFALQRLGQLNVMPRIASGARTALLAVSGLSWPVLAFIAALALAAVLVYKYWEPIKAFFGGLWLGLKETAGPVLNEIAAALAPLKPLWDMLTGAVKSFWDWLTRLLGPMTATDQQLNAARESGQSFGRVIGTLLGNVLETLTFGIRMFVKLGVAIGECAGWVTTHWEPVKAWFGELWDGIATGARNALDWIEDKLSGITKMLNAMAEGWRRMRGENAPTDASPIEWIMPEDRERARRVSEAIGRSPLPGSTARSDDTGGFSNATPIAARGGRSVQVAGDNVQVHINAAGMDQKQVQEAVRRAMEQQERDKQARVRSAYSDDAWAPT